VPRLCRDSPAGFSTRTVGGLDRHRIPKAGYWPAYENAAEVNRRMLEFFSP